MALQEQFEQILEASINGFNLLDEGAEVQNFLDERVNALIQAVAASVPSQIGETYSIKVPTGTTGDDYKTVTKDYPEGKGYNAAIQDFKKNMGIV